MQEELVLYAIVSEEAVAQSKGARGKMAAQTGHAFCGALFQPFKERSPRGMFRALRYMLGRGTPKLVLVAPHATILELQNHYKDKFGTALVMDAGRTVFNGVTLTALGIGPMKKSEREEVLANLRPWQ